MSNLKNEFKIVEYNWPNLDLDENFNDPDKFLNLLYDKDLNLEKVFQNSNDLRDQLYFFDLKEIINLNKNKITHKIKIFKTYEN